MYTTVHRHFLHHRTVAGSQRRLVNRDRQCGQLNGTTTFKVTSAD
jgi:hypothetical protein